MTGKIAARKQTSWLVVSQLPDVCKTPMGSSCPPVPYPVIAKLEEAQQVSPNVKFNGHPAIMLGKSFVATTLGDEAGSSTSVASGTVGADTWLKEHSPTVKVNGYPVVRQGDECYMNGNKEEEERKAKKARYECRKQQIEAGQQSNEPQTKAAADRFAKNNYAIEKAQLSDHIYDGTVPTGWREASKEELAKFGLDPTDLQIAKSDFRAKVYMPDESVFGSDQKPTLVFKGTTSLEDWKNNFAQGGDMYSPYYEKSVTLGKTLGKSDLPLDITGHSLGGGMGSAASVASGKPAFTFNAAGLHSNTVSRYGGSVHTPDIQAYRVDGDPLGEVQHEGPGSLLGGALIGGLFGNPILGAIAAGVVGILAPDAAGVTVPIPGTSITPVGRHSMDDVIAGIEQQKTEDQGILAQQTGVSCS